MNITETYQVRPVEYDDCKEWLLHKHYAHRIPCISYAFGLYNEELRMVGCCTYGLPANRSLAEGAVEQEWADKLYELNRLVVDEGLPRNVLSFFVAQTLKMLPKPLIIVSYADDGQGHHGYIYQATNWAYTGLSQLRGDWKVKGLDNVHNRHLLDGIKPKEGQSVKEALMEALKIQDYKIKFMSDKGLESCLRITLGRKEQTQTVVDTILKVIKA